MSPPTFRGASPREECGRCDDDDGLPLVFFFFLGRVGLQLVKENLKRRTHGRHYGTAWPPPALRDKVLVCRISARNDCFRTTAPLTTVCTLSGSRNQVLPIHNQADGLSLRKATTPPPSTTRWAVFAITKCGRAPTLESTMLYLPLRDIYFTSTSLLYPRT